MCLRWSPCPPRAPCGATQELSSVLTVSIPTRAPSNKSVESSRRITRVMCVVSRWPVRQTFCGDTRTVTAVQSTFIIFTCVLYWLILISFLCNLVYANISNYKSYHYCRIYIQCFIFRTIVCDTQLFCWLAGIHNGAIIQFIIFTCYKLE